MFVLPKLNKMIKFLLKKWYFQHVRRDDIIKNEIKEESATLALISFYNTLWMRKRMSYHLICLFFPWADLHIVEIIRAHTSSLFQFFFFLFRVFILTLNMDYFIVLAWFYFCILFLSLYFYIFAYVLSQN